MELFPQSISRRRATVFDVFRQRIVGRGTVQYRDLILSEDFDASVNPQEAGKTLAAALALAPPRFSPPTNPPQISWPASPSFAAPCRTSLAKLR